ncbi:hypothetical protein CSB37_00430 [bacterium DOLZORAL124_38_8]|nr:MAG: hypothetical protein CSB37_00430 [bacterium DOLZORAL124_38_8]
MLLPNMKQILNNKTFRLWRRSVREGILQMWRNKFLSITTIGLGVVILFLLNFVFGVSFFADYSLKNLESRADFLVPLELKYDPFEYKSLQNELGQFSLVTSFRKAETFGEYAIEPRLHIKFNDLQEVPAVFKVLKKKRYEAVVADWDTEGEREFLIVVEKLLTGRTILEKITLVMGSIFLVGGVLLAINAFQIILFSRKREIFVARLVGADPWFIVLPFIIEGLLLGFMAFFLGAVVFTVALKQVTVLPAGEIFEYLLSNIWMREFWLSGAVGGLGAWIAARKYLFGRLEK